MRCKTICRILWLISVFLPKSLILFSIESRPPYQFEDGWTSKNTVHHPSMWWLFVCLRGRIGVDFARCLLTIWLALTMDSCPLPNDEEDWVLLLCDYVLVSRFTYISITVEHKRKTHLFSLLSSLIVLHTPVWKWTEKARGTSLSFHYDFVFSNNRCDNTLELKIKTVFG